MIQVANVGVGIRGKEGNSASSASDFSIGEFKLLDRLILHHGRWFYYRLSYYFVYYGWKNLILTLLLFFFMIQSAFSAFPGLSEPFMSIYNIIIGLVLVCYYAVFEQDINDDLYPEIYPSLPLFYKDTKERDLFSFKRYLTWTFFAIAISIFMYVNARYGLGSYYSIAENGRVGTFSDHTFVMSISLSFIIIMVLISDIKSHNWFSGLFVVVFITIIITIIFFIVENFMMIGKGTSYHVINNSTFRFWQVIFLNVGVCYAGKMTLDSIHILSGETLVEKTIRSLRQSDVHIRSDSEQ